MNSEPETSIDNLQHDLSIKGAVAIRSGLFRSRYPQMAPPRLSMRAGPSSTPACVAQWRNWKPAGGLDCDEVTLIISIEDTGANQLLSAARHSMNQLKAGH